MKILNEKGTARQIGEYFMVDSVKYMCFYRYPQNNGANHIDNMYKAVCDDNIITWLGFNDGGYSHMVRINESRKKQLHYCLKRRFKRYFNWNKSLGRHKSKWMTPCFCRCSCCINPRKRNDLPLKEIQANRVFKEYLNDL